MEEHKKLVNETPIYEWDCVSCRYLGRWISKNVEPGEEVDLWICPNNEWEKSWVPICRFDAGYSSGREFIVCSPDLNEAAKRGIAAGHISQEQYDKVYEEWSLEDFYFSKYRKQQ